ncbi:PD-(D/E)XK nuclease family protein [Micromonospora maritima]|uniref:PD-(D/E)XK nuclease family protein n=1 Tax=Micromonospora maritima TaxID=986711 RepID=UPI003799D83E
MIVEQWESRLNDLAAEAAWIKGDGRWHRGPRTLLQVLNLHQMELPMVALLGWMLEPEGYHGLGNYVVRGLFEELGLPFDRSARVYVSREELRVAPCGKVTRADLVVRVGKVCLLLEAKINAKQHGDQCRRLQQLWGDEANALVYLTRYKAESSLPAGWRSLTWRRVSDLMTPLPQRASAGVREFVETVQILDTQERASMLDEKTQFYLRHWSLLSEWAALRSDAMHSIESTLIAATASFERYAEAEWIFRPPQRFPTFELRRPSWQRGDLRAAIALQWDRDKLLTDAGPWPYVGVRVTGVPHRAKSPLVLSLAKELEQAVKELDWPEKDLSNGWLWWRRVEPAYVDDVPDGLASACCSQLHRGWRFLSSRMDELFTT